MAIYHCHAKIVSRTSGRSSVGASAYRAGEKIQNENDGMTHDYRHKIEVEHSEIMLCENAPAEYKDRKVLWNEVEKSERSNNARLAREIQIALPIELSKEENIKLVQDYVKENFVNAGMCADINIHDKKDGNPHAHIMLTIRAIDEKGNWENKKEKVFLVKNSEGIEKEMTAKELVKANEEKSDEWQKQLPYYKDGNGNKKPTYLTEREQANNEKYNDYERVANKRNPKATREGKENQTTEQWNSIESLESWRESWANSINRELEKKNIPDRVDHRSYEAQGIEKIPKVNESMAVVHMEQKGITTDRGNVNREIEKVNIEIAKLTQELEEINKVIQDIKTEKTQEPKEEIKQTLQQEKLFSVSIPDKAKKLYELEEKYISANMELKYRQTSGQIAGDKTPQFEEKQDLLNNQLQKAEQGLNIHRQAQGKSRDIKDLKENINTLKNQPLGSIKNRSEIKNKESQIENRQQELSKLTKDFTETTKLPISMQSVELLREQKETFSQAINIYSLEMKENYLELQTQATEISMEYKTQLEILKDSPDYEKIKAELSQLESNRPSDQYPTEKNGYRLPSAKSLVRDIDKLSRQEKQKIAENLKHKNPEVAERLQAELKQGNRQRSQEYER